MRKFTIAITFIFLLFSNLLLTLAQAQKANNNLTLSKDQWREDLKYLATELPKRHKNLFFKITRQDFEREVTRINENIPKMQDFEVKIAFMRLAAIVSDAHTGVSWRSEDFGSYPVQFYSFSDGWYATSVADEYRRAVGARLVQIGDTNIEDASAKLRSLIPCENASCFRARLSNYLNVPEFLYALRILPDLRQGKFVFEDRTGEHFTLEMRASTFQQEQNTKWSRLTLPQTAGEQTLWLRNQNVNYWYEYSPESKMLYFAYNRCQNLESQPFKDFTKKVLDSIDTNPVERLVIDMRRNGGGNEALLFPFIAELLRRPAINRRGHLFVIVGRGTFSSAAQNAITLKEKTQAIIIGEPTGQKPNHYGELKTFRLPNSGLGVNYSTEFWKRVEGDPPAFMPDILAEPSFADFSSGRDPAITAVLRRYEQNAVQ